MVLNYDADTARWADWMRQAQVGDAASYTRLLREILPFVRAVLRGRVRPEALEDVVQDVLLTVHRVRHSYDPSRPFPPWVAAIAHRRAIDATRRHAHGPAREATELTDLHPAPQPDTDPLDDAAAAATLHAAIACLPARQRQALELVKLRELSLTEAASQTGQSEGAIKVNVHRGLASLRRLIGPERA